MASTASFRFTNEAPSSQMFSDAQNLNAFSDEQLEQFVDVTLAFLAQSSTASDQLAQFAETHKVNTKALKSTVKGILFFFSESLKKNLSPAQVKEDLINLGVGEGKAQTLSQKWAAHFVSLSVSMMSKTLTVNQLVDMDWKFGVTAATNELSQVGNCFLQLKLTLDKGGKQENVVMELSLPQFYQFLQSMQNAHRQLSSAQ